MFKKSTKQLDETINDLVRILVIKSNANIGLEEVKFEDILLKTTNMLSSLLSKVNTKIGFDFDEALSITSNPAYMESIFMNLLSNALKYRNLERQLVLNVYTKVDHEHQTIKLCFEDNGLGIDLERNKDKIFGLHQRFHEQGEGKGIGLYLIQSQIKALGGSISVESVVNEGTTFIITFNQS